MTILIGWDIAQTTDNSIITVVEKREPLATYSVKRIVKLPRGMPYDEQVRQCRAIYSHHKGATFLIDRTGVGLPICDMIVAGGLHPVQVSITAGDVMTMPEPGKVNLPKKDLVASITKVIQEGRLKVVPGCENVTLFRKELKNFRLKVSASGHNAYNAGPGSHDDTITAIGLCLWQGERARRRNPANEPTIEQACPEDEPEDDFGLGDTDLTGCFDEDEQRGGTLPEGMRIPGMFH